MTSTATISSVEPNTIWKTKPAIGRGEKNGVEHLYAVFGVVVCPAIWVLI